MTIESIQNKYLANSPSEHIMSAIQAASNKTGVDFAYMVRQAAVESSFNAKAKAKTSTASGLYQFTESTWLSMVNRYGAKHGMKNYADKINDTGKVANQHVKKEILALRNDPEKSSAMAAELAAENKNILESRWGGDVGPTELYIAHFLGAGNAASFLKTKDQNPLQQAALIFPNEAKSNRAVFYDTKTGRPKTMGEIYASFDKKFEMDTPPVPASKPQTDNETYVASLPEAQPAQNQKAEPVTAQSAEKQQNSIFSSLFTNAPKRALPSYTPAPYVNALENPLHLMLLSQLEWLGKENKGNS